MAIFSNSESGKGSDIGPNKVRHQLLTGMILSVTNFLAVIDGLAVVVALPAIQSVYETTEAQSQLILTAYLVPLGGGMLLGGRLGDRIGRGRALVYGLCGFCLSCVLAALSPSFALLLFARFVQGCSAALAVPSTFGMISDCPDPDIRRSWFAAVATAGGLGAAGGAILGGIVTEGLGWQFVFVLSASLAGISVIVTHRVLITYTNKTSTRRIALIPSAISVVGMMALILTVSNLETHSFTSTQVSVPAGVALISLVSFGMSEIRSRQPVIPWALLRQQSLKTSVIGMVGEETAYQGSVYIGLLMLQSGFGFGPLTAGLTFVPLGAAVLMGSAAAKRLLPRTHWAYLGAWGLIGCSLGLVLMGLTASAENVPSRLITGLILVGFSAAVAAVALNGAAGLEVPTSHKATAYGMHETSTHLSAAFAITTLSAVSLCGRTHNSAGIDDVVRGFQIALWAAAGLVAVVAVLIAVLGRKAPRWLGS
ncbi:MFS transporter [Rothia koreensis]|uniref:MFS transporter n=1 Tax=Rothia koreensis TaxID=592378 RepID=UPI0037C552BD